MKIDEVMFFLLHIDLRINFSIFAIEFHHLSFHSYGASQRPNVIVVV